MVSPIIACDGVMANRHKTVRTLAGVSSFAAFRPSLSFKQEN